MKILAIIVVAAALGTGAGIASTSFRLSESSPPGAGGSTAPNLASLPGDGRRPRVVVDQESYDFGVMERNATGSHAFVFTNTGDYPLSLTQGETSCKCTISKLAHEQVAPGESVEVTLEWSAKASGGQFRQSATILTNDPARPRVNLSIEGQLSQSVVVQPSDIVFSRLAVGEPGTANVRLVCYTRDDLQITSTRFSHAETAALFHVDPQSVAATDDPRAKSAVRLTVGVKPGLPVGAFSQQLIVKTNATGQSEIAIPIQGRVTGDVALFGPGWNAERGLLVLGTVKSAVGVDRKLTLLVHGREDGKPLKVKVAQVTPAALQVRFGEARDSGGGRTMTPLHVSIAKGTAPISRVGPDADKLGEIVLETNHPRAPEVQLQVRFAVVD